MAEFRKDPIVDQWVIVHTDDSWGPEKYAKVDHTPRQEATCQFCPGRENLTPPEVDALRLNGSEANSSDWKVRVVPNKFPALRIEGDIEPRREGLFDLSNGVGAHEVVIETPDHFKNMADYSKEEIVDVLQKYQSRLVDLTGDKRFKYITIFKNYGESAGATVEHAHSQIIALPMVPKYVLQEIEGAQRYFEHNDRCVFCDIIEEEQKSQERLITENDQFVAICPFVPRYPFECWVLPKGHHSKFSAMQADEMASMAEILKDVLNRIKLCLFDPSYNFYLHLFPINSEDPGHYHWHLEIVPKLKNTDGFEWGTGFYVVRTSPSVAAQHLRDVISN